ncbi:hypothetical protein K469DRAFT_681448 [Zopfia rhizophila CBS 207.26]|uniref:Uncharacterized protein n=1 Tax=Zopfia rhizophila CBS 207.26 TaxID=1314779 RepID=A0A6A6EUY6_9PEZI|nr:hypothetical protein K469DRAFT_681448 [Zopfia rhizophila CBS 207.26]
MCHLTRHMATECPHPIVENVDQCEDSIWEGLDQCEGENEITVETKEPIEGKCMMCQQMDAERREHQNMQAVIEQIGEEFRARAENADADFERIMEESRREAEERNRIQEADEEAQIARLMEESRREFQTQNQGTLDDVNANSDLAKALAASRRTTPSNDAKFEYELAQALALSKEQIPTAEDEEAQMKVIMEESLRQYQDQNQGAYGDEDAQLQAILELSKIEWHRQTWQQPPPPDLEASLSVDMDPQGRGKGHRPGAPTSLGQVEQLQSALSSFSFFGLPSSSAASPSHQPGTQSQESKEIGAIRAQQQAAYEASLAADREKAKKKKEEEEAPRKHAEEATKQAENSKQAQHSIEESGEEYEQEHDDPALLKAKRLAFLDRLQK